MQLAGHKLNGLEQNACIKCLQVWTTLTLSLPGLTADLHLQHYSAAKV